MQLEVPARFAETKRLAQLAILEEEAELVQCADRIRQLERQLSESERDRAARLDNNKILDRLLREAEEDRRARLVVIERQAVELGSLTFVIESMRLAPLARIVEGSRRLTNGGRRLIWAAARSVKSH